MTEFLPISRFVQRYNDHLAEAERTGDMLVLQQRAGRPSWVLETEGRVRATAEATDFLSAALAALVHDQTLVDRFTGALAAALPWVTFLPDQDRATFAAEATDTLRACVSLGRYTAFADLIEEWRNTAAMWSDRDLAGSLATPIATILDVPVTD